MIERIRTVAGGLLTVALVLTVVAHWPKSFAATQKRVYLTVVRIDDPVAVTEVTLAGKRVQAGRFDKAEPEPVTAFDAYDDWIQNLSFSLFNRTNKAIVYMQVMLSFPDTTVGRSRVAAGLLLGCPPIDRNGEPVRQPCREPLSFGPTQVMTIRLADRLQQIKRKVEHTPSAIPLAAMTTVTFAVQAVWFADSDTWSGSQYRIFDPQTRSWREAGPDYFPGDKHVWWPPSTAWLKRFGGRGQ